MTFSEDSAVHACAAFPDLADRITVEPHELLGEVPHIILPLPRSPDQPQRVLGNIGYEKDAAVVLELGRRIAADPALKWQLGLVLVGNVDSAYMPPSSVPVHGDLEPGDDAAGNILESLREADGQNRQ